MHVQKINSKIEVTQESRVICYWSDSDEEFGIIHESRWKKTLNMIFKIFLVKGDLNLNLSFILRDFCVSFSIERSPTLVRRQIRDSEYKNVISRAEILVGIQLDSDWDYLLQLRI